MGIWKNSRSGKLYLTRASGVVVKNTLGIQVAAYELQEFDRQKIGRIRAPIECCVHENEIKLTIRVADKPSAAVINDDMNLWILQKTRNDRPMLDQLQVPGIDFDDSDVLDTRMISEYLRP